MSSDNPSKTCSANNYIFGPVPSRRLGRSIGIDLVPYKTCSYDCIYCQLGKTTNKTIERKEWVPLDEVINQLKEKLYLEPDYITLSGSGEPTLFSRCSELISRIKEITDTPVAVLTNGSMLWLPEVRASLLVADRVVPSLDAGNNRTFQYVNRPHPDITFDMMLDGLITFRKEYKGQYWLEVFLLAGINDTQIDIQDLQNCIALINPDMVQVNTVTRPPAEDFARRVSQEQINLLAEQLFSNVEVIADYKGVHQKKEFVSLRDDVLTLLQRRPCSIEDIASGLSIHRNEVVKYVEELLTEAKIKQIIQDEKSYYSSRT